MSAKQAAPEGAKVQLTIPPPKFEVAEFEIQGISPYVQHKFSKKGRDKMKAQQEAGSQAKKGKKRDPRDFKADYEEAQYRFEDGGHGLPAAAIRAAMISACRLVGFKMTITKMALFILDDGYDKEDHTALVRITKGKPEYREDVVRNQTGVCDIRARPMWAEGWRAKVRIRFDADWFKAQDVANLLMRAGMQVGIGEGRPDSKESAGMGWGLFECMQ